MLLLNPHRFGAAPDYVPAAIAWADVTDSTTAASGYVETAPQQITGINQTINLRVVSSGNAGGQSSPTVKAFTADTSGGAYTEVDSDTFGAELTFSVTNGKWVKFRYSGATTKGSKTTVGIVLGVYNDSNPGSPALLDTVTLNLTVDSGDIYGYDYQPNAVSFADANLTISSATATGAGSSPASASIGGTEKPFTVGGSLAVASGGASMTCVVTLETSTDNATWSPGCTFTCANGVTGFQSSSPSIAPGSFIRLTSSATTPDGVARSGSYVLTLYWDAPPASGSSPAGDVLDTVSFSVALNGA